MEFGLPLSIDRNRQGLQYIWRGYGTKGKAKPGQTLIAFLSGEYSINQRWVLAFDSEFLYQRESHYTGKNGATATGEIANTKLPASMQISFAAEVEYDFALTSGLLTGVWFTLAGKNSAAVASAFLSYLYVLNWARV